MTASDNLKVALLEGKRLNGDPVKEESVHPEQERRRRTDVDDDRLASAVASGVKRGIHELLADEETMDRFWETGYKKLTAHVGNNASQWVGRRILAALIAAVFVWALAWMMKNGAIK